MKIKLSQLRRLIREELERNRFKSLLREVEAGVGLSGKSLSLVGRLAELNRELEGHGIEMGVKQGANPRGGAVFMFAIRSTTDPTKVELLPDGDLPKSATERFAAPRDVLEKTLYGSIDVGLPKNRGECSGALVVRYTSPTTDGWGPLLYDLAMEFATQQGGGLASDRDVVSPRARAVWNKYDAARPDVQPVQLDWLDGPETSKLTPDDETDDCRQDMALHLMRDRLQGDEKAWSQSPLSRAYRKPDGTVTAALDAAGLLWR